MIGASALQLHFRPFIRASGYHQNVWAKAFGCQSDVEVVGIGRQESEKCPGSVDTGRSQMLFFGSVADPMGNASSQKLHFQSRIALQHTKREILVLQPFNYRISYPSESAHNVMIG